MAKIQEQLTINYRKKQIFDLINDIEKYPSFVPNCIGAAILEKEENWIVARLDVEKAGIAKSFTTRNTLADDSSKIDMDLVEGPFQKLSGKWLLEEISPNSTKITLDLDVVFQGHFLDLAFSAVFKSVLHNMLQAFVTRAKEIYG